MRYIVRQTNHIESDIERNWSSWNFGQDGIECTEEELNAGITECLENEQPLSISGFELWNDELRNADIRELYEGYWVLVDTRQSGLSACELDSDNLEGAINEVSTTDIDFGSEEMFDCSNAKVVWSNEDNDLHILEIA